MSKAKQSELKHTPGPWTVEQCEQFPSLAKIVGPQRVELELSAFALSEQEEMSNARLIAAAPEMLEALRAVAKTDGVRDLKVGGVSIQALIDAAIAKAEGRGE